MSRFPVALLVRRWGCQAPVWVTREASWRGVGRGRVRRGAVCARAPSLTLVTTLAVRRVGDMMCDGGKRGINRHGEGDGRALHRRSSESRWPRAMRWRPVRAQRSVVTGVRAGGLLSLEIAKLIGVSTSLWIGGRQDSVAALCVSRSSDPARSENPCMRDDLFMHENREISRSPAGVGDARLDGSRGGSAGRPRGEGVGRNPVMHDHEKSEGRVVRAGLAVLLAGGSPVGPTPSGVRSQRRG